MIWKSIFKRFWRMFKLFQTLFYQTFFSLKVLMIMFGALLRLSSMREMSSLLWNWKLKIDIESEGISSKIWRLGVLDSIQDIHFSSRACPELLTRTMAWIRRGVVLGMGWVTDFNTGGLNSGSPFDQTRNIFRRENKEVTFRRNKWVVVVVFHCRLPLL